MTAAFIQPFAPTNPIKTARAAISRVRPVVWFANFTAPALLALSFLQGNGGYWIERGLPWLLTVIALQIAGTAVLGELTWGVTKAGEAAAVSNGPGETERLTRRVIRLPKAVLISVLLLNLPSLFTVILLSTVQDITISFLRP